MKKRTVQEASPADVPALSEGEWVIMEIVWEHAPCAAGTVQEALQETHGWAYSTVKTTMDRMCVKGILEVRSIRNLQLFSPIINREQARGSELQRFLKRAFHGAVGPLIQFLVDQEEITTEELDRLRLQIQKSSDKTSG